MAAWLTDSSAGTGSLLHLHRLPSGIYEPAIKPTAPCPPGQISSFSRWRSNYISVPLADFRTAVHIYWNHVAVGVPQSHYAEDWVSRYGTSASFICPFQNNKQTCSDLRLCDFKSYNSNIINSNHYLLDLYPKTYWCLFQQRQHKSMVATLFSKN